MLSRLGYAIFKQTSCNSYSWLVLLFDYLAGDYLIDYLAGFDIPAK